MNIEIVQTAILAASAAILISMSAQAEEGAPINAEREHEAWREQLQAEARKSLPPLAGDLFRLQRTHFASPKAKQEALRQWQAANGSALKAESDARRETERPEREKQAKEARIQFEKILNEQVEAGDLSAVEAEFIKLTRAQFTSGEQRRDAIEKWRAEKGPALDAERENRRVREAPRIAALQAEASEARRLHIDEALQTGQIGAREAEFMRLHQRSDLPPAERQKVIRQWMSANGAPTKPSLPPVPAD